jgi:archaellum component FlaF (FlaF/FlaG flagellin family)
VDDFDYLEENPKVGDKNLTLYVKIDNKGTTTVNSYGVVVQLNGSDVLESTENALPLAPGQSVVLAVPMGRYWDLQGVKKDAGTYRTDIDVYLNPSSLDADNSNNGYYMTTEFK